MNRSTNGFTLIELLIVVAIAAIFGMILLGIFSGFSNDDEVSVGVNGVVTVRCIDGYKYVIGHDGQARQVMDQFGTGVRCP